MQSCNNIKTICICRQQCPLDVERGGRNEANKQKGPNDRLRYARRVLCNWVQVHFPARAQLVNALCVCLCTFFCFWFQSAVSVVLQGSLQSQVYRPSVLCGAVLCARLYALNFEIGIESNQLVVSVIYINQFLEIKPAANVRRKKGENKGKKTTRFFFFFFLSFFSFPAEQFDYETWILMIQQEEEEAHD